MNWRQCQGTLAPDRPAEKTNTDLRFSVKRAAGLARSKSEDEWEQFKVRLKETDPMCEQALCQPNLDTPFYHHGGRTFTCANCRKCEISTREFKQVANKVAKHSAETSS